MPSSSTALKGNVVISGLGPGTSIGFGRRRRRRARRGSTGCSRRGARRRRLRGCGLRRPVPSPALHLVSMRPRSTRTRSRPPRRPAHCSVSGRGRSHRRLRATGPSGSRRRPGRPGSVSARRAVGPGQQSDRHRDERGGGRQEDERPARFARGPVEADVVALVRREPRVGDEHGEGDGAEKSPRRPELR